VKDTDQIGALPGDELDKMLPYVMPLADHCGGVEGVKLLLEQGQLEVIPLGFLRGRSLRKSIIISSEAENLTKEHIQLMLGRIDEGSNLWMDAALRQRDRIAFEKSKGIETMIERLSGDPLFGYVHLVKTERSKAAQLADKLD
jgi:PhoH-like ATPase